jgi:hypothetical protein
VQKKISVRKTEGYRELGRPRRRMEDNIKKVSSRSGIGRHGLDCSGSGYVQESGVCECGNKPSGSVK